MYVYSTSSPANIDKELKDLKNILMKLKYPQHIIDRGFQRATNSSSQKILISPKRTIHFLSTYNKNNPNVFGKLISPMYNTLKLNEPFSNFNLVKSYRQPKSLLRLLNKNDKKTIVGINKCGEPRCGSCETLRTGKEILFVNNDSTRAFSIKANLNCLSMNVIYAFVVPRL